MKQINPAIEILRWGNAEIPAMLYYYAPQFDLDLEDLGILGAVLYAYSNVSKPLFKTGIEIGQVLQVCPSITRAKLTKKINKWQKSGLIEVEGASNTEFAAKKIRLEPMYEKMVQFIMRDHPDFKAKRVVSTGEQSSLFAEYERRIEELELALKAETLSNKNGKETMNGGNGHDTKKIADFIAKKTGGLVSLKMETEIRRWMDQLGLKAEYLMVMLELCFERGINHPREITKIATGLKECSINNLEAMEKYFKTFVDEKKSPLVGSFDPEVIDFGDFTGIDMNAEARKKVYYKWRYDWGYDAAVIKKAGEIMCSRTKNGGLEYIDTILDNWRQKGIKSVQEAEQEKNEFRKERRESGKQRFNIVRNASEEEPETYLPPAMAMDSKLQG